jgi:hypothetical protein
MFSLNNLFGLLGTIMSIAFSLSPMQTMLESLKTKQIKHISVVFLRPIWLYPSTVFNNKFYWVFTHPIKF